MEITSEERNIIQSAVKEFAENELEQLAPKIDSDAAIPQDLLEKLSSIGLLGILSPQEYGGVGADIGTMMAVTSELAKACASTALVISNHNLMCSLLTEFGSEEQKSKLLPHLSSGKKIGAVAISEGLSSLDLEAIKTLSAKNEGSYTLNGMKPFVVNGSFADVFIILSRVSSMNYQFLIVEKGSQGFVHAKNIPLLGARAAGITSLHFDDVSVPKEDALGTEEDAPVILRFAQEGTWFIYASSAVGIGRAALDASIKYATQRIQFGKAIGKLEAIQRMIFAIANNVEAMAALMEQIVKIEDHDKRWGAAAATKVVATETATESAKYALKIHGGYGFIKDYPVERHVRDAKSLEILGDINEDLKTLYAKKTLGYDNNKG